MNDRRNKRYCLGQNIGKLVVLSALTVAPAPMLAGNGPLLANIVQTADPSLERISGVVVDAQTNEPLISAMVAILKDGKVVKSKATDENGKFVLFYPAGDFKIQISYIGYKTQVLPSKTAKLYDLTVKLQSNEAVLGEAVVTGFFVRNKKTFTGSVTQLDATDLKKVSGVNVVSAIAALTPGMNMVENSTQGNNPNKVPELLLRGMTSFSNEGQSVNQPTIILDGSEITMQDLYDLDMNEIENITVLKDASATALYGSKAANGVIVITRKILKEGTLRAQYNFTGNVQIPVLGDYDVLNAADKLKYEQLAGLYDAGTAINPETGLPLQYDYDRLYNERYQRVMAGQNSDWLSQPARTSFSHDHSLRIYGGAQRLRYELIGRFSNTEGVMKDDYRRRYNLGFKLDYFINNKIQVSNRTTYNEIEAEETPYGSFSQYVLMNPYDRMYNADGSPNVNLAWDLDNPLYEASLGSYNRSGSSSLTNITDFRWDINKKFRLTGHFNVTTEKEWGEIFVSPKSRQFKNEPDLAKRGSKQLKNGTNTRYNGNVVATFNHFFEDESLISMNGGWEINHGSAKNSMMRAIGFFNDANSHIGNAAGYPAGEKPFGDVAETADVGFFLTGNYSWRQRYFADATWRMTGSSQFGKNNRFGHFWATGLGWNVLNEPFMEDIKPYFDIFKLRGSAGYTGKVTFSPFQAMTMYQYLNNYEYKNGIGAIPITIGNVDLAWERTMNYNVGLDFSMFNNRLNITVDAYIKNTTDLLMDRSKAPSTGVTMAKTNLGELQNKGIEFKADGFIFRENDFYWKLGTTGYMNRNKIRKINNALEEMNKENLENAGTSLTPLPQYAEGESVSALKLVRSAGIDPATGKEVYIKRDGTRTFVYDPADRVVIGDTEPKYYGTVNTNLYWKGFSVYALFDFRMGAWLYNTTRVTKVEGSNPKMNADQRVFDDRWRKPGDVAYYKDIKDQSRPEQTDRFAEKENTFSLSSLNISYEFAEPICKRFHMHNLRVGVNFIDLFRFSTVDIERGTDYLYSKGFEINLSATF